MHYIPEELYLVAVQVGVVKIYVVSVKELRQKERQGETQKTIKIDCFPSFNLTLLEC
jgi:hypothetical protein